MATSVQLRRGTTTQNNAFTGALGEVSVDQTLDTIRVHDGSTAGGFEITQNAAVQTLTNKTLTSPKVNEDVAVTSTATELNILDGVTATTAELNILDASVGNTALATDVASSAGAGTSNNAKIKHTLTLAGTLADDATHADVTITNSKVLASSVVLASCSLNVDVRIHTVVAGSFKVSVTNKSGSTLANDSTMILNYRVI
jgi:hypothetical protein